MEVRERKAISTSKQKALAIALNSGVDNRSKYEIARSVGYSHAVARKTIQDVEKKAGYLKALKEIEPMLREKRNMVLNSINAKKISTASLKDTAIAFDILNKHHVTATGGSNSMGNVTELRTLIVNQLNVFRGESDNSLDIESKGKDSVKE